MIIFHRTRAGLTGLFGLGYIVMTEILMIRHFLKKSNAEAFDSILLGIRELVKVA